VELYLHSPNTPSWRGAQLKKRQRDNFTFMFILHSAILTSKSRDSSVGIALGYGLDDRGSRVRFPVGAGNFSLHHHLQNGSGVHRSSYPMGTRSSLRGGKATGA
jgi:hypothetical protein